MAEGPGDEGMRVSDADRASTAERLRLAHDEGRLSLTEYDERLQQSYAAVVRADLDRLTGDLPVIDERNLPSVRREREVAERRQAKTEWYGEWRSWAGTSVLLLGIWGMISLVAGDVTPFWPIFPIGIWALVLIGSAFERPRTDGHGDASTDKG
ncbi:DUF1707 domain-containing protein [Pseudonocardia sp. KRD291]|uniref:DUF1707 SHOCT-like domain-containing protein n=1 Tax=Pseudonocardia sp. KRD291 TaxID=2792007 RepID=UPI001C49F67A|nr:DUF1707 domain-containing protein [Pseudonocardia sp. KRD291]MBW0107069.1 DUF1707 domain-containing protein [Pseudonocardia sp. KRD291]